MNIGNLIQLWFGVDKYGIKKVSDLPKSTSINKQITYGEFIVEQEQFREKYGENFKVYNAFIIPYAQENGEILKNIGVAYSDWKTNKKAMKIFRAFYWM